METKKIEKTRLEAFSDGVIAIILTIMVLELKVPHESDTPALLKLTPVFFDYTLSFIVVAIMWVNHHHFMHAVRSVTTVLLWLNINLLFWMSLIPFSTAWMGDHPGAQLPVALYGLDLTFCSIAFWLLRWELIRQTKGTDAAGYHHKVQVKNSLSLFAYASSVGLAFFSIYVSYAIFVIIPAAYFLPERKLSDF
jgi:uncharacterized membrane protein